MALVVVVFPVDGCLLVDGFDGIGCSFEDIVTFYRG